MNRPHCCAVLIVLAVNLGAGLEVSAELPLRGSSACDGIEIVFFDLGDTLVEDPGGGIFVLRSGAADTIADLQLLGIRLGIITNVPAGWGIEDLEAILAEPEFLNEFEVVVLSSQAGASKPDPAIYTFAYSLLGVAPPIEQAAFVTETIEHIADLEVNPTEGARAVGMVGIHLSDLPPSPLTDFTVPADDLLMIVDVVLSTDPAVFCDGFESGDTLAW